MSPKGGAEALHAFPAPFQLQLTHPVALQGFYRHWRAAAPPRLQERRGTGTIFRPVLTMTSDKTSTTEPFASVRGIAGTAM